MDNLYLIVGFIVCGIGGFLFAFFLIAILAGFACVTWIAVSEKFRDICQAESLIFEYRKNRQAFLLWKQMEERRKSDETC